MFVCVLAATLLAVVSGYTNTPLDDYVWKEDENYGWTYLGDEHIVTGYFSGRGWKGYTLNMTSQRWLTDADFAETSESKSLWWHYLVVVVPDEVKWTRNASLYITGGGQSNGYPEGTSEDILVTASLALANNMITGCLFQVPNEHTTFAEDPIQKSRSEDAIIAYTWDHFLKDPSQPNWLVRFPMVKASLRAMDTITAFMKFKFPEMNTQLDYYSVAGASKRGWTTWLVGAVDPTRVVLIVPIVLDAINFVEFMHHQYRAYGNFSFALSDYSDMQIMSRIDDPNMLLLQQMEDPYFYKERLTMPKLIVNAVLDEFQQPDDSDYWWDEMPSPKRFLMTPNAEHSEATGILEVVPDISQFIKHHLENKVVPEFTWEISESTGEITVKLNEHGLVHEADLYYAYSCGMNTDGVKRRDFRVAMLDNPCPCGFFYEGTCANFNSTWAKVPLESTLVRGHRTYNAKVDAPGDGRWVAFLIMVTYKNEFLSPDFDKTSRFIDGAGKIIDKLPPFPHDLLHRLAFTSQVSIWPNTNPYSDCKGESCGNGLV